MRLPSHSRRSRARTTLLINYWQLVIVDSKRYSRAMLRLYARGIGYSVN
jgi:hypothetical protein